MHFFLNSINFFILKIEYENMFQAKIKAQSRNKINLTYSLSSQNIQKLFFTPFFKKFEQKYFRGDRVNMTLPG